MTWTILIYLQERGTKKEKLVSIDALMRTDAFEAVEKLEKDVTDGQPDSHIVVRCGAERLSFLKQDYRGNKLYESG